MQAGRLAMECTEDALAPFGLTVGQFAALALIHRLGGVSQAGLVERLGMSKSSVSRLVIGLLEDDLVQQALQWRDGRQRALYTTPAGADLAVRAAEAVATRGARFAAHVGDGAIRALAELAPPNLSPVEAALRAAGAWATQE
jgi:DNA-binding MarR family transcriptional regulator